MVPREIFAGQRIVGLAFAIAFVSGMNFYSALNFFPIIYEDLFSPTPLAIGTKAIGAAFGVSFGAVIVNGLLSVFKDWNRELLLFSCVLMSKSITCNSKSLSTNILQQYSTAPSQPSPLIRQAWP